MWLGIGELKLRKKVLLPEIQSLAEILRIPLYYSGCFTLYIQRDKEDGRLSPNLDDECDSTF